jgi:hypothetical protein
MGRKTRWLLVAAFLLVACSPSGGGEDAVGPKPDVPDPDIVQDLLEVGPGDLDVQPDVPPPIPAIEAELVPQEVPCKCPSSAAAGCIVASSTAIVAVKASHDGELSNIASVKLSYAPNDATLVSVKVPDPADELFKLKFDIAQHEKALLKDGETVAPDGQYTLLVEVTSKLKDEEGVPIRRLLPQPIFLDRTGPKFTTNSLDGELAAKKFANELPLDYCLLDLGCGKPSAKVFLGEKELVSPDVQEGKLCQSLKFNVAQYKTEFSKFKIVGADCLGNETIFETDMGIIGLPNYELPGTLGTAAVEKARLIRAFDLDKNFFPDLLVAGSKGIAVAYNDGKGGLGEPELIGPVGLDVVDLAVFDVNGDSYPDLVILANVQGTEGEKQLQLQVYFEDSQLFVVEGTKYWEPLKTWPELPSESHVLPTSGKLELTRLGDLNMDGNPDVLLAGPEHTLSAAILLHTGEKHLVDEASPERPGSGSPQKVFFTEPAVFTGIDKITDAAIGNFKGSKDTPEIAFARGEKGIVTVMTVTPAGTFGSALDTLLCFDGGGVLASGDLFDDPNAAGVDDLVVTSPEARSVYLLKSAGNGYFKPVCMNPDEADAEIVFGKENVANVVADNLFDSDPVAQGTFLSVGDEVDSMVLIDLLGKFGSGSTDSVPDLAVAVPGKNYIAIFRGEGMGTFSEAAFVNPGSGPHGLITADFNMDTRDDLACLVKDGMAIAILFNRSDDPGRFDAPVELPMPVAGAWKSGRLEPTHLEVGDLDFNGTLDLVAATSPAKQVWAETDAEGKVLPERDAELALVLSWLFLDPQGEVDQVVAELPPRKSAVDVSFDSELTGFSLGDFNNDGRPDLAVSQSSATTGVCDARTFDLLLGGYAVIGAVDPTLLGSELKYLDYYVDVGPTAAGHFRPLGGFAGLSTPSGLVAARLDDDGLADILLYGTDPDRAATYLTRWDSDWNGCAQGVAGAKKPWFTCSPPLPIAMAEPACTPATGGEGGTGGEPTEPGEGLNCLPNTGNDAYCGLLGEKPAQESDKTALFASPPECGLSPIAAVVGEFYKAEEGEKDCPDVVILNKDSDDATYLRGTCGPKVYKFHDHQIHLFNVGFGPVDLAVADLDQDGFVDIVTALAAGVSISYGQDGEYFAPAEYVPVAGEISVSPTSLVVEDVNDDELPDLLVTSGKEDRIQVWLNGGDREFFGPHPLPTGQTPRRIRVADLDGDSCKDVAVLNEGSRTITILRNKRCDE